MDEGDLWSFGPNVALDDNGMSDEEVVALVKRATGIDLPYKIVWRDVWKPSRALADRYQQGRVFLAGHSCHLHPDRNSVVLGKSGSVRVDLGGRLFIKKTHKNTT